MGLSGAVRCPVALIPPSSGPPGTNETLFTLMMNYIVIG